MTDQPSANDLRDEIRDRTKDWEDAEGGSRREFESAEAFTRAWAELDAGLTDGTMDLPYAWEHEGWIMVKAADVKAVLPRVEKQITLLPGEKSAVERLQAAVAERKNG